MSDEDEENEQTQKLGAIAHEIMNDVLAPEIRRRNLTVLEGQLLLAFMNVYHANFLATEFNIKAPDPPPIPDGLGADGEPFTS